MNDAVDAGMDTADDQEASEKVYQQICDEIGVDMGEDAISAGDKKLVNPVVNQPVRH